MCLPSFRSLLCIHPEYFLGHPQITDMKLSPIAGLDENRRLFRASMRTTLK